MSKFFVLVVLLFSVAACTMPSTTVRSVDSRPSLSFAGAPDDAIVLIDGLQVGTALFYNGEPNVLLVEPGTHRVEVVQGGVRLYDQRIFVESEHKRIVVR